MPNPLRPKECFGGSVTLSPRPLGICLGAPAVPFYPFSFWVPLLKPNSRKKGTLIIKGLLGNLDADRISADSKVPTMRARSCIIKVVIVVLTMIMVICTSTSFAITILLVVLS